MRTLTLFVGVAMVLIVSAVHVVISSGSVHTFEEPIDALSIGVPGNDIDLAISARVDGRWTDWRPLELETEFDPLIQESNLVVFPKPTEAVRMRGSMVDYELHPIRIAGDPIRYELAATTFRGRPRILTRRQWGANESFLVTGPAVDRTDVPVQRYDNGSGEVPQRVLDCEAARRNHPEDFRTTRTVASDNRGRRLRWPQRYSPSVKLLVVHHTALEVGSDDRPPVERVRALYEYHANSRGWGDIGYHYLIDEEGQIYEGRAGGGYVVGGHVYCGNVGTIGVALLGNFEIEEPTQVQMQSLKWLLTELADRYNIRLNGNVSYHGKRLPRVVGHKDLITTVCPGYYVAETLGQVRSHLLAGRIADPIVFPRLARRQYVDRTAQRRKLRLSSRSTAVTELPRRVRRQLRLIANSPALQRRIVSAIPLKRIETTREETRDLIRIRLSYEGDMATLEATTVPRVNGQALRGRSIKLRRNGSRCEFAAEGGGMVRIDPGAGLTTIKSWDTESNTFRGIIECNVLDGQLVLINELPLEDYLRGLAEEPDSEPWQKQRAFAIAARSYAAHYMSEGNRKFPDKPYDGDDSPAHFQAYSGFNFEQRNPQWARAVSSTKGKILTKDGDIIRAAYFSSSDGRTRSPVENGWKDFPHAEVFSSKADPWCKGLPLRGHGVGMSGCGAEGQAQEGTAAEEILTYYYPGTTISKRSAQLFTSTE